jgi:hypothetical protein
MKILAATLILLSSTHLPMGLARRGATELRCVALDFPSDGDRA